MQLLQFLELRLDNVAYRAGWGASRSQARQFVRHGHVTVNGKRVTIPSYQVQDGDTVEVASKSREMALVLEAVQSGERQVPEYLTAEYTAMKGSFVRAPKLADVPFAATMEPHLVVEYYSR